MKVTEGEIPSLIIMGSKYKKKLEREWGNKSLSDIKIATLQKRADRDISRICMGELIGRRYK